jgi:hypothetical protein
MNDWRFSDWLNELDCSLRSTSDSSVVQTRRSEWSGSSAVRNIAGFSAFLFPGVVMKLASPFSGLLTQPSNERLAFFGLTERVRLLFTFNLWLFRCADPKVWMIRFVTQLRVVPRFHYFRVTFYWFNTMSLIWICFNKLGFTLLTAAVSFRFRLIIQTVLFAFQIALSPVRE